MTEAEAEKALAARDWATVQEHVFALADVDEERAQAWRARLRDAVLPRADAGERIAQSVMGSLECWLGYGEREAPDDALERGLGWLMKAASHPDSDRMVEQVHHWYGVARERGLRFAEVERFLADPAVDERYRRLLRIKES
jgi:hypothetical protein